MNREITKHQVERENDCFTAVDGSVLNLCFMVIKKRETASIHTIWLRRECIDRI